MNNPLTTIDIRKLVFPIVAGKSNDAGFYRTGLAGTGFFVGNHGLAFTAGHVIKNLSDGYQLRAALPAGNGPMSAHGILWAVFLPDSDIAVIRVNAPATSCFAAAFNALPLGTNIETVGIPEHMLLSEPTGRTEIRLRSLKGYVSHGTSGSIEANFALPKGMSGAPLIESSDDEQHVVGVFVGQSRGEVLEDYFQESTVISATETRTEMERTSRVEYFAKGEVFAPYQNYSAPVFEGMTLSALITEDIDMGPFPSV